MQIITETLYSGSDPIMQQFSRTNQLPPRVPITPSSRSSSKNTSHHNKAAATPRHAAGNLPAGFKSMSGNGEFSMEGSALRRTPDGSSILSALNTPNTPNSQRTPKLALTRADFALNNTYSRVRWKKREALPIRLTRLEDKVQYNIKSPKTLQQACENCQNRVPTASHRISNNEGGFTASFIPYPDLNKSISCPICGDRVMKTSQDFSSTLTASVMDRDIPARESWTSHSVLPKIAYNTQSPSRSPELDDEEDDSLSDSRPSSTRWSSPDLENQQENFPTPTSPDTLVSLQEAAASTEGNAAIEERRDRLKDVKPRRMSEVLLERHKTQLRNKSRHPGGKLPLVEELLETKDVKQFESKLLEKFNILAESLAESDSDNNSVSDFHNV